MKIAFPLVLFASTGVLGQVLDVSEHRSLGKKVLGKERRTEHGGKKRRILKKDKGTEKCAKSKKKSCAPSTAPSLMPSPMPSMSTSPSLMPSMSPSNAPSTVPSLMPSPVPSMSTSPSLMPSPVPSMSPSSAPSTAPSLMPSPMPSLMPSPVPSMSPSIAPSTAPSLIPSPVPSMSPIPSLTPSTAPSLMSSPVPSLMPSPVPSMSPSSEPTMMPTLVPTEVPSALPTLLPSLEPSVVPSPVPTCPVEDVLGKTYLAEFDLNGEPSCLKVDLFESGKLYFGSSCKSKVFKEISQYSATAENTAFFYGDWDVLFEIMEDSSLTEVKAELVAEAEGAKPYVINLVFPTCSSPSTTPSAAPSIATSLVPTIGPTCNAIDFNGQEVSHTIKVFGLTICMRVQLKLNGRVSADTSGACGGVFKERFILAELDAANLPTGETIYYIPGRGGGGTFTGQVKVKEDIGLSIKIVNLSLTDKTFEFEVTVPNC